MPAFFSRAGLNLYQPIAATLSYGGRRVRSTDERPGHEGAVTTTGDDTDAASRASRTPSLRADRADLACQLLLPGAQRLDGGSRLGQLLGRLLRGTLCPARPGPGRGGPRG